MDEKNKKVSLITGASSGIGEKTALKFLSNGMKVYAAARRVEKMVHLKQAGADTVYIDMTDERSIRKCVKYIIKNESRIDILVNNAGYGAYGSVEDIPLEEARHQFEVNLFGPAYLIQLILPYMRENKSGKIINISSMGGKIYTPLGSWYHATKHALEGFSDCLRLETEEFGIDTVIIEPGGIKSGWDRIATESMKKYSGKSAYSSFTGKAVSMFEKTYNTGKASDPGIIADLIYRSVTDRKPKIRYSAGHMAIISLLGRKLLPDRLFDQLLKKQL